MRGAAEYSQCKGKHRYRHWSDASKVKKRRENDGAGQLRIYECPICRGHHLTKQKLKELQS